MTSTISPLRQRMIEDMAARLLGRHSQRSHIHSCKRFAAYLKRSPDNFVPWRFSDACRRRASMAASCRRPRNLHTNGHDLITREWARASNVESTIAFATAPRA
jgi:hypothetical protein